MDNRAMLSYQVRSAKTMEDNTHEAGESPIASVWRHGRERGRKEHDKRMDQITNELRIKDQRLEDMNATLKVLLQTREMDRKKLEQSVSFNVRHLAEPCLEMLKNSGLNETQRGYLDTLRSILREIASPLSRDLVVSATSLTPSQARIANLVKFGKSSKEIAEALNLSVRTIETHRRKIRTKLGLNRHKTNLRSFLDHHTASSG